MNTIILFVLFIVLLVIRVPVALALAISSTVALLLSGNFAIQMITQRMVAGIASPTLLALPGFILAGAIMTHGGLSRRLVDAVKVWIGHISGGLGITTILSCMVFAAISGSSPATAAAMGNIMIPEMVKAGHNYRYALGCVAAGGTLGILIPPSLVMIVYGIIAEESIGKLFIAGIIPGIIAGICLLILAFFLARGQYLTGGQKAGKAERWKTTMEALPALFMPILIIGGIYLGIFTPTEASVVSAVYALMVSLVYRELNWQGIRHVLRETVCTTAMIYLIIAGAMIFSLYLTNEQVPHLVTDWMKDHNVGVWQFFLITMVMIFILGTFLEGASIAVIVLPLLLPLMKELNINLIHFAVVFTVNLELAMITPPVGLNLFVVCGIARKPLEDAVRGVLPFILALIGLLILFVVFPDLSLYLPGRMK